MVYSYGTPDHDPAHPAPVATVRTAAGLEYLVRDETLLFRRVDPDGAPLNDYAPSVMTLDDILRIASMVRRGSVYGALAEPVGMTCVRCGEPGRYVRQADGGIQCLCDPCSMEAE